MREETKKSESSQTADFPKAAGSIREKVQKVMKEPGKRKFIYAISLIVFILVMTGMCTLFYSLGKNSSREPASSNITSKKESKDSKKKTVNVTTEAVVSESAVTAEGVLPESSGESVNAENAENAGNTALGSANPGSAQNAASQENPGSSGTSVGQTYAATGSVSTYAGKLTVVGNQLCTADGTPIQLRGVSTHGLAWFPEYVNSAMFAELKAWGANTVRLAMYTAEYNGYCTGGNRAQLKELIKKGVNYATEQGLYVIIDWHVLSDGNPNTYKSEAVSFFAEMAELYKDNDHVLYEICNEPNGGVSWGEIKGYANEVIAVIRQRDPDGVILVGTPTWSQEVDKAAADPITGYNNVMYTLHFYADTHRDSLRNTLARAVEGGLPVFVSEFGICDASGNGSINIQQADIWIQTLNKYGISYVAWNLSNKAESSALIQAGCSKTSGFTESELSESGKWLLRTLQGTTTPVEAAGSGEGGSGQSQPAEPVQDNPVINTQPSQVESGWHPPVQKTPEQYNPQLSGGVEAVVVNSWQEGNAFNIQYEIKVGNTTGGEQDGWSGTLTFPANAQVISSWNANFSASGNVVNFSAMDYNKMIQPGGKVEGIGCIVRFE